MFSTEEFIRQYQNLANADKTISHQANQYILKLQQSNEAFTIAKELLDQPNIQQEYQFIACQMIYRRLKEECNIAIQPYLLELLARPLPTVALNQVCSSLAVIIVGNRSLWEGILQELVVLMKAKMTIGIEILTQIAIQGKEWYKKSEQLRLQQEFITQENTLSEIFLNLLWVQDLSVFNQTVYCIECWVQFSYNIFKDLKLTQQILSLLHQTLSTNATEYSDKLFALLNEGVIFSQYNRQQNVNSIEAGVLQNLNLILEFIIKIYSPQLSKGYASFVTKFICDFYAIVFNSTYEQAVFNLMGNIVSNPSRKIAFQTFEFWSQMREYNKLQGFGLNILQTMIDKCRMKTIKLTKEFLLGEPEEEDADYNVKYYEGGQHFISTSDFREHSKDIFYSIYKSAEMNMQSDQYFQIVLTNLVISSPDSQMQIIQSESALFSLCSIIDEADIQINNQLILQIVQFILSLPVHQNFDIIVKTSLQMFSEFTNQLQLNSEILLQITQYFFKYMLHPLLGPLAGVAFEQICNLSTLNNVQLITESVKFLELHFSEFINQSQVSNYIEGIIKLCYRLFTQGSTECLIQLFNFANHQFQQVKNPQVTEKEFNYNNTLVITILQWMNLNARENDQIKQLLDLLCQSIFEPLIVVLQGQQSCSLYDEFFKLIRIILKVSNYQNQQQVIHLLQISYQVFHSDPIQKHNWLQLITQAIGRSADHQFVAQWAKVNDYQIHLFCIEQFKCWKDPDLMKVYVEYVKECIRCCQSVLFESPYLQKIIDVICDAFLTLNSYEMQREILYFFKILFQCVENSQEYFNPLVVKIIKTLFMSISDINPAIVFQVVQILTLVLQKQVNPNELEELIYQTLQQSWGKDKPVQKVKLVSQAIISYLIKPEQGEVSRNLKLLLENLRPMSEEEINYMQLEIAIKRK
ncbi:unnamed protein product (macronuclear) [Paramecium tetraurelia]|uniref:Importin N-terminal domain-containing protein n=1 Tax=Paramecium tetraurelia TaxID=5888 RepID=A0CLH6_PARTE|nr:uncharacterized protein GSPATT00008191001 [Paramecium tetraurelia]CAK71643.1 unnamed protein product [Paramecium tetraurelia]|eukprot:XP_001439040.1 hypothetical protein (macronuclear) [Paramecium tetraurelia strain d4-2]